MYLEYVDEMRCKFCVSEAFRKSGFTRGKQRYFCKSCERNQVVGDNREKHSKIERYVAVVLYLEGNGFRRIARILHQIFGVRIHDPLIIQWIKKLGFEIRSATSLASKCEKIPLLEMDELYTYIKKKRIRSEYGLLLIETGCVLLDLKSVTQARKL
jgi:transposase-like protein